MRRPGQKRRYVLLLAVALPLLAASCSGDNPTLSRAEFVERANSLCAETNEKTGRIVGKVLGAPDSDPNDLQRALDHLIGASRGLHSELAALRPPRRLTHEVRDMLAALAAANAAAEAQGPDFWESEDDPWAAMKAKAAELGLDACS
jgi:hypothetical protein